MDPEIEKDDRNQINFPELGPKRERDFIKSVNLPELGPKGTRDYRNPNPFSRIGKIKIGVHRFSKSVNGSNRSKLVPKWLNWFRKVNLAFPKKKHKFDSKIDFERENYLRLKRQSLKNYLNLTSWTIEIWTLDLPFPPNWSGRPLYWRILDQNSQILDLEFPKNRW